MYPKLRREVEPQVRTAEDLAELFGSSNLREIAELVIANIESVAEACARGWLSHSDVGVFRKNTGQIVTVLIPLLQAGSTIIEVPSNLFWDEIVRILKASQTLDEAYSARLAGGGDSRPVFWRLRGENGLIEWWNAVDRARLHCEQTCSFYRTKWDFPTPEDRQQVSSCIQQIESRIPLLRSHLLSNFAVQYDTIEKCMLLCGQILVYGADLDSLRLFATAVFGSPKEESDALYRISAVSEALAGPASGQEDWMLVFDSTHTVWKNARRLAWRYRNEGLLDSKGRVIRECAFIDPLDTHDESPILATIDQVSLESARHPCVGAEIDDLEAVMKKAGLKPRQRKVLLMRRNGKIMSRSDVSDWKRGQRAIKKNRSKLVAAIEEATKKRIIKSPPISAGNYPRVYREGGTYARSIPGEDQPFRKDTPETSVQPWFKSNPPPIARSDRKKKNLFKKVSTEQ
jgi:hypothetical protein